MSRNRIFGPDGTLITDEWFDVETSTYTLNDRGVVTTRPLTAEEVAQHTPPPPPPPTPSEKLEAAKAVLAQVTALAPPILTADVAELLKELKEVL